MDAPEHTMDTVLAQLNGLPGVVGSLVCAVDGSLLAQAFPSVFDLRAIQEAARALSDGAHALEQDGGRDDLLDLRFREVRLLAKPFAGRLLAVLCSRSTNLQLLTLSVTAATAKLEKVRAAPLPEPAAPVPSAQASSAPSVPDAAPATMATPTEGPVSKSRVAIPSKGLDELRRRLGTAAEPPGEPPPRRK
jgi:predicted regulator of Ras-like GTPase activity (Roadblock/LC7/MglB family)